MSTTQIDWRGTYPAGAIKAALSTLEAVRVDYEAGPLRSAIDDALDRLYRYREIETGAKHPYRDTGTE